MILVLAMLTDVAVAGPVCNSKEDGMHSAAYLLGVAAQKPSALCLGEDAAVEAGQGNPIRPRVPSN